MITVMPDVSDYLEGMADAADVALAVKLGYTQYASADTHGYTNLPMDSYVLPVHPFTRVGKHVVIRELVLEPDGWAKKNRVGRPLIRAKLRPLPA